MTRPLVVALHGVGSSARDMATALSPLRAVADVVALDGGDPFDGGGSGRQWFSVHGVTEANRSRRVLDAVPPLLDRLDRLAAERGVAREDLVLLGFSQGAIMALAMVAQGLHPGPAIAIAGRLAAPVIPAGGDPATVLLVHDSDDSYMPAALSEVAKARLAAAGHNVNLARTVGVSHGIGPATFTAIADWLAATASFQPNH